jgi:hypothetical protein
MNTETTYTAWEDMPILEQYQSIYWDMYKDAYGFRPRNVNTDSWTVEDFEKEFQFLGTVIERNIQDQKIIEQEAIRTFEALVSTTIQNGAADRDTAIRWILDDETDVEHFEWQNCLPFGYLKEFYYNRRQYV